jgi:hypothetical protein
MATGGFKRKVEVALPIAGTPGDYPIACDTGVERAHDHARQRGIADLTEDIIMSGALAKFNTDPDRVRRLVAYIHNIDFDLLHWGGKRHDNHHERIEEPNIGLEKTYQEAYARREALLNEIESYSHFGIFTFIHNYHLNWVDEEHGRDATAVQRAMLNILFPLTDDDEIWAEYQEFEPKRQPEMIWQFSRARYRWAKNQWPNLSDRVTTIWTLQDFDLIPKDVDVKAVVAVAGEQKYKMIKFPSQPTGEKGARD